MPREIAIVFKDVAKTGFMQSVDVFEKFKFVGEIIVAMQESTHYHLSAVELLSRLREKESKEYRVVGVIIPQKDSAFLPEHRVLSCGGKWSLVEDICKKHGAIYAIEEQQ